MTRDEIIKIAREAGFDTSSNDVYVWAGQDRVLSELTEFAHLVAAAEREACAKVCDEIEDDYREREGRLYAELKTDAQTGASDCAYQIRARGGS